MTTLPLPDLHTFIVKAKSATYVGDGQKSPACRPGSHDLTFRELPFAYLDSYFGGTDFIGQEVVYYNDEPVWAMNYYGYILRPDLIDSAQSGHVIRTSLSAMYAEGRFLGSFEHPTGDYIYTDTSDGDFTHFTGKEWITRAGIRIYELVYGGGLVKP